MNKEIKDLDDMVFSDERFAIMFRPLIAQSYIDTILEYYKKQEDEYYKHIRLQDECESV